MTSPIDPIAASDADARADPSVRTFFALVPDEPVRVRLLTLAREIARRARGRAVLGDHVHLTLAFLGDVPAARIALLREIGDRLPHAGAVLTFDTLGAWRASGVAWVAPSVVSPALITLHDVLDQSLRSAGFALETRPFRPHVTLARRCVQPPARGPVAPIVWPVRRLCLVGSELRTEGPAYTTLAQWPLSAGG